jgi:hypothetical protein
MPLLDYHTWGINRQRARATAQLRWWIARQMLAIDCQDVGGRTEQTAIPLWQYADAPERYHTMLRYARCAFGRDWRLERIEQLQREGRRLECLLLTTPDERRHRLWFDVTPERN